MAGVTAPALDSDQRQALERAIGRARKLLETDLAEQAEGRFGVYESGVVDDEESLRLDPSALADRRELVDVIAHLHDQGESEEEAVVHLIREAAFTHLNRLVAIRIAEALDLLPPSLRNGKASQGFRDVLELAPSLGGDETGGYWTYLRLCGDELAGDAPALFDPRNPLLRLAPSPKSLDELVDHLSDPALAGAWEAPDALGWTYQFFNSAEERRKMRDESPAPRNSRELAVRNQFFTPRYVVDFLVHNTLGRRLVESDPSSPLRDELEYLVDPPEKPGAPLVLSEVKVLDPACGSGHFLLGAYDVLERAWELQGVSPEEAAPRILPTLWGIDIDPRCAQVASAALIMRARRHCRTAPLPRPNLITARALPQAPEAWDRALAGLPKDRRTLLEEIKDALVDAPVLGSLLKAEERLAAEIKRAVPETEAEEGTLFEAMGVVSDRFGQVEAEVLTALQRVADGASSTAAERLLAAEAGDAIRFIEAVRQRYDAVLMNPPFGEPVPSSKDYLKAAYPWAPSKDLNLLALFVGRGAEIARQGGYVGAITSRVGLFLVTYEKWRTGILFAKGIIVLADLGFGVMEGALVEAAAYVLGGFSPPFARPGIFLRLLKDADRSTALRKAIEADRLGESDARVFRVPLAELAKVAGSPISYWVAPSIRRLQSELPAIEGNAGLPRQGLATGDDFRFVRASWEVPPWRIARSRDETTQGGRWAPFAKGGEYSPYFTDAHLLVDWEHDGDRVRTFSGSVIRNAHYYFLPGVAWNKRTTSGFGPQVMPAGFVFSTQGPAVVVRAQDDALLLLSVLNSRLLRVILDSRVAAGEGTTSGTAARHYEVGLVQGLPWVGASLNHEQRAALTASAADAVGLLAAEDQVRETTRRFVRSAVLNGRGTIKERTLDHGCEYDAALARGLEGLYESEEALASALDLDDQARRYLDDEYGSHPGAYPRRLDGEDETLGSLYQETSEALVESALRIRGGSRALATKSYFLNRRLELLSHTLQVHPSAIADSRRRLRLLPAWEVVEATGDLISYLVGCAFGRWDIRIGKDASLAPPLPDPFDPVPICPPGMLVGEDGMPTIEAAEGYPLGLPSERILLDEPGHRWNLEETVRKAAAVLFDDPDAILDEAEQNLGKRSLRDYLRKQFFKDHLSRYSKSRRKAPIYWYLSVPSREWGLWLYAPTISRERLFAVAREAARRETTCKATVARLQSELGGATGTPARMLAGQLEADETLAEELRAFRTEADRIAALGWEPDLDDGIILCAAPLADLFPAWPDAFKERANLRKGAYPWASVSEFAEKL